MRVRTVVMALLGIALAGCARTARQKVAGPIVDDVHFRGNGGLFAGDPDYLLRKRLEQQGTALGLRLPLFDRTVEPRIYQPERLVDDAYRLEVWYAHNGWFDAAVTGWETHERNPARRRLAVYWRSAAGDDGRLRYRLAIGKRPRAAILDVIGHVDPGERSLLRKVEIVGLRPSQRTIGKAVLGAGYVAEGQPFVLDGALYVREALREQLLNQSYPYAKVDVAVDAWPAEQAVDVKVIADPGVSARIGAVTVVGNERVPTEVVLDEARIVTGQPWRARELTEAQARLYQLGTFSVVAVETDLSDPTATQVDATIRVVEGTFKRVRAGAGLATDGTAVTPRVTAEFQHLNAFRELVRFDARAELGAAYRIGASASAPRPVFLAEAMMSHPRLFGSRTFAGAVTIRLEQDLRNGQFAYRSPQVDATMTVKPDAHTSLTFGPHYERFRWLDLSGNAGLAARLLFGEGFQNPYELATIDVGFTFDNRDDYVAPTRGRYLQLSVRQAVPFGPKSFFYTDLSAEGRIYRAIRNPRADGDRSHGLARALLPEGVAGRLSGQVLQSWGGRPLPYPELAFLGGANDLRGFFNDQVGAYDCLCLYEPSGKGDGFTGIPGEGVDVERFFPARGGAVAAVAIAEVRYKLPYGLTFAFFAEGGVLAKNLADVGLDRVRWDVGFGPRYASVVGPVRLDLAFRPIYPEDAGPTSSIGCVAGDARGRPWDMLSLGGGSPADRKLPFAIGASISVGQGAL